MKQYILKGKNGKKDILFTVDDLIPIRQRRRYSYSELSRLIDYTYYQSKDDFNEGYEELYRRNENKNSDFFRVKGTKVIIIPGRHVFPTTLTLKDIE